MRGVQAARHTGHVTHLWSCDLLAYSPTLELSLLIFLSDNSLPARQSLIRRCCIFRMLLLEIFFFFLSTSFSQNVPKASRCGLLIRTPQLCAES